MSTDTYQARIDDIRDGAIVRRHLGQAAHHRVVDGRHEVSLFDYTAGKLRTWTADTLDAAIENARRRER